MNPADFALPGGFPTTDIDDEDDMGSEVEDGSETGFTPYQTCVNLRVTSAARESVRALIESKGLGWHDAMDELAQQVVDLQVSTFNEHAAAIAAQQADSKLEAARQSLFESTALKIAESIGDDVERDVEALKAIPSSVSKRALWRWDRIPYAAFCALGVKLPDENGEEEGRNRKRQRVEPSESLADVDDW